MEVSRLIRLKLCSFIEFLLNLSHLWFSGSPLLVSVIFRWMASDLDDLVFALDIFAICSLYTAFFLPTFPSSAIIPAMIAKQTAYWAKQMKVDNSGTPLIRRVYQIADAVVVMDYVHVQVRAGPVIQDFYVDL
jgi:hypothetical protein